MRKTAFSLMVLVLSSGVAESAPIVGIDLPTAANSVSGSFGTDNQRVQISPTSKSYLAQQSFLSSIPGATWGVETFEEFKGNFNTLGQYADVTGPGVPQQTPVIPPNGLMFAATSLTASVTDAGNTNGLYEDANPPLSGFHLESQVIDVADPRAGFGRNNTTTGGSMFFTSGFSQLPNPDIGGLSRLSILTFDFSSTISAFGFYLTDLFDQGSDTTLEVRDGMGNVLESYSLLTLMQAVSPGLSILAPSPVGQPNANTGDLAFVGIAHATADIKSIRIFSSGDPQTDIFGIDDFYVTTKTNQPPVVPEPSTLALAGLALTGGILRYRRQKAA